MWGQVEQAVATSMRGGDLFADVTARYTSLIGECDAPGHCAWARQRYPNSDGEIQGFWMHVLATCGDEQDRVLFRDLEAEPRAVARFYTAQPLPPFRLGADDGALLLAVERLIQRGANEPVLQEALWTLLRVDNPEAAEQLAAVVDGANLDVRDEILKGLAGQSHEAAVAAVSRACDATPDKADICSVASKPQRPSERDRWLAKLAAAPSPDRVQGLLEAHPEHEEAAVEHLSACGEPCSRALTLVAGDSTVSDELDALGVTWRSNRVGGSAFADSVISGLEGRGRLVSLDLATEPDNEHVLRHLLRIADVDPAEMYGSDVVRPDDVRVAALETLASRWEVPVDGVDLDACITLTNHALEAVGAGQVLVEMQPDGARRRIAALPTEAVSALSPPG